MRGLAEVDGPFDSEDIWEDSDVWIAPGRGLGETEVVQVLVLVENDGDVLVAATLAAAGNAWNGCEFVPPCPESLDDALSTDPSHKTRTSRRSFCSLFGKRDSKIASFTSVESASSSSFASV